MSADLTDVIEGDAFCPQCGNSPILYCCTCGREAKNRLPDDLAILRSQRDALAAMLRKVQEHLSELRDAWQRGAIDERDGGRATGWRSNINAELESAARALLASLPNPPATG